VTARSPLPTKRRFTAETVGFALVCAALTLVFGVHLGSAQLRMEISDYALAAAAYVAAGCCLRRARVELGRTKSIWVLLGFAALSWGIGQSIWDWYEAVQGVDVPFPSLADVGYLAAVPLLAAALLRQPLGASSIASRARALLDGLMIATSMLLVSWVTVLAPELKAGGDVVAQAISLAYPIGDVAVVTVALFTVLRARTTGRGTLVPVQLIGFALCGLSFADSGFAYLTLSNHYASGDLIDAGWFTGWILLAIAARKQHTPVEDSDADGQLLGMLLPYVAVIAAFVVSSVEVLRLGHTSAPVSWLRTSIALFMVARQLLTLRENVHLTRNLERRVEDRTAELTTSKQRFEALVKHSSDVVAIVEVDGFIRYVSESVASVFGYEPPALVDRRWSEIVDSDEVSRFLSTLYDASLRPFSTAVIDLGMRHASGRRCHAEMTVTNLLGEPSVRGLVLNTRDISERKQLEQQLVHEAFHDSLTALANRALFEDRVKQALLRRQSDPVAVLFLDLDGFKEVNDSLGHAAGDVLLCQVADRLRSCVRHGDTVARFGGDEFAILLDAGSAADSATQLAERIAASLEDPFTVEDRETYVRASIGIAAATPADAAGPFDVAASDSGQLLRNADLAMYRAKAAREGGYVMYDPQMHAHLVDRLDLAADLRLALRDGQLLVHYQPVVALGTGLLIGVEALVRWQHPERGLVSPASFIPLAEETGLIHQLGRWVLAEACGQASAWHRLHPDRPPVSVAVNVSGRQLQRADFIDEVTEVLLETGLEPGLLTLEITESVLIDDYAGTHAKLIALRAKGVRVAIDDFGTGYSSLSYLHQYPVDVLKIDRSFIQRLGGATGQEEFVQTILRLGESLRLTTVAEGIEDHAQMLALRRLGCHYAQGFHLGRPGTAESITALLEEQAAEHAQPLVNQ
jgi:diguanylate cyclase (GGDEF)-like protein/PAS domain S-box-containing protein